MHVVLVFCFCVSSIMYGVEKGATFALMPQVLLQHMLTFATMLRSSEAVKDWENFALLNKSCHAAVADTKLLQSVLRKNGEYELFKQVMQIEKIVLNLRAQNSWRLCECERKQFNCLESSRLSIAHDVAFSRTGLFLAYGLDGPRHIHSPWGKITVPELGGAYRNLYDLSQQLSTTFYTMFSSSVLPQEDYFILQFEIFAGGHLLMRKLENMPSAEISEYRGKQVFMVAPHLDNSGGMLSVHKVGEVDLEAPSELGVSECPRVSQVVEKHWKTMKKMYAVEVGKKAQHEQGLAK